MYRLIAFLLFLGLAAGALAEEEFLKPDQAFPISAAADGDKLRVRWNIADGYYLYRSKFRFSTANENIALGSADLPPGEVRHDPFFGEIEIYRGLTEAVLPLRVREGAPELIELQVRSQGCADAGICYPPHTQTLLVALDSSADQPPPVAAAAAAEAEEALDRFSGSEIPQAEADAAPAAEIREADASLVASPESPQSQSAADPLAELGVLGGALGLDDDGILSPAQAYRVDAKVVDGRQIQLDLAIAEGTYLYEDKLVINLEADGTTLGEIVRPPAKLKHDTVKPDGTIGDVAVYVGNVSVAIPLQRQNTAATEASLLVKYQGCAERGICYPPQKKTFKLSLPAVATADAATASPPVATVAVSPPSAEAEPLQSEQDQIASMLKGSSTWLVVLSFFGIGLLLSLTPCVFPMIPILSGIIAGQGASMTARKAFVLSVVFVLAMSVTYTVAGVLAGLFGSNLQAAFQNPWILSLFAGVFVALALSMFGFYELQLPSSWQSKLSEISNRQQGGHLPGVAVMGFLSALIVGPCVAPPLAGALIFIGQTGDWLLGGIALFAMSLGMGTPLIAIGTSAGKFLPRAGSWMDRVKAVFGVIMLGLAITMLERFLPEMIILGLWGVLMIVSAIYMGALQQLPVEATGWSKLWKGLGVVLLVYGSLFLVGVAADGRDTLQPLRGLAVGGGQAETHLSFRRIKSVADLERELVAAEAAGRPVMLDFYADWCLYCKLMEKNVFPRPKVKGALAGFVLLQADVTAQDEQDMALMARFQIPAPPAIIFWNGSGKELRHLRVMGEMNADEFAAHVGRVR